RLCCSFPINGVPAKPGWLVPSIVTGVLRPGNTVLGAMVCTPDPGIAKSIMLGPAVLLESGIACRSESIPKRLVFLTMNVVGKTSASRDSRTGRYDLSEYLFRRL